MTHLKKYTSVLFFGVLSMAACKDVAKKEKDTAASGEDTVSAQQVASEQPKASDSNIYGDYVSAGYENKDQGSDWVAVTVSEVGEGKVKIKVRSRADKKKPTCTFDALAYVSEGNTYTSMVNGKSILYSFENDQLTIAPQDSGSQGVLAFYCSGGATVSGTYTKIDGPVDASQVDQTLYSNVLMLQGVGFNISATKKDGKNTLTVLPFGLEAVNDPVTLEIEGEVTNVEIEDLNSDGSPDVVVYTQTLDDNKYGNVYAFSTNNKKSMSQAYFPPVDDNGEINKGYEGRDEFSVVETSLVQRFPIFENGKATGKMRQISYKLKDGEAMRSFVVDQVNEF